MQRCRDGIIIDNNAIRVIFIVAGTLHCIGSGNCPVGSVEAKTFIGIAVQVAKNDNKLCIRFYFFKQVDTLCICQRAADQRTAHCIKMHRQADNRRLRRILNTILICVKPNVVADGRLGTAREIRTDNQFKVAQTSSLADTVALENIVSSLQIPRFKVFAHPAIGEDGRCIVGCRNDFTPNRVNC